MTGRTFQEEHPYYNILNGIQERNVFNTLFFSKTNIDNIQNSIINGIFKRTGKVIEHQKEYTIATIMRGIYLQEGGKTPANKEKYTEEFERLNSLVTRYAIDKIEPNIKQQIDYIKDIYSPLKVIDRPLSDTTYGTKTTKFNF